MSLRFLKISNYYRGFIEDYYQRNSLVKVMGYTDQYRHLMDQYFAWSDNYGQLLADKGMETMEIVGNAEWMQKAWALENGLKASATSEEIILNQIIKFSPEVIYFQDNMTFNGGFVRHLRTILPKLKLCIGNLCAPFGSGQVDSFKAFNYFTVCSPFFKLQLNRFGIESVVIPHAFDGRILNSIENNNNYPPSPIVFLGSIFADEGFHCMRREILENLVKEKIQFNFYGNLPDRSKIALIKKQASFLAARTLDRLGLRNLTESVAVFRKGRNHDTMPRSLTLTKELYQKAQAPLFGLEMFKALSRAEVGFNIHIDCAGDYAANMRMFETTGVGTCLLTDRKSNLKDYFLEDTEVVAYDSVAECMEKIKYLIDNPSISKEIGISGQRRTLAQHNFESRVNLFYEFMMRRIK